MAKVADLKPGVRVKVIASSSYKKYKVNGECGVVIRNACDAYGKCVVKLDNMRNNYGATGYHYFKPFELEVIDEKTENNLEENTMANITNYLNIAKVKFLDSESNRTWEYANFDTGLQPGDICVVMTGCHGMSVAEVVEIVDRNDIETSREIVAKVDMLWYNDRVKTRKEAAELKAKMQERAKKLQDIALFQMLAKEDSEMMDLLNRYQSLPQF